MDRIAIVGASLAGLTAADALRAEGFDGEITIFGAEPHPPYVRPPLSKGVLHGTETVESVALAPLGDDVDLRLGQAAVGLDLHESALILSGEERFRFDGLVVATGARARSLAQAGQPGELTLRGVDDVLALRARLAEASDVLVVGGGLLGMEIASTCVRLGRAVTVVDREPPLQRLLGSDIASIARRAAVDAGVRIEVTAGDVELIGQERISGVRLADGRVLRADLVISAVGDVPNVEWLANSGLRVARGLIVGPDCRALPHVVGAGDAVEVVAGSGSGVRRPHWDNAVNQARLAARSLLHGDATAAGPAHIPYFWTEQFGLDIRVAGGFPVAGSPVVVEGALGAGSAVLRWDGAGGEPMAAVTVNHRMPIGRLKRLATRVPAEVA